LKLVGFVISWGNFERFGWFRIENAGKISRDNWANIGEIIGLGAKTGKVDDEDELEVDVDEEHTA